MKFKIIALFIAVLYSVSSLGQSVVVPALAPFYHGVASGDPLATQVIIWTRVTPENAPTTSIEVKWSVATDKAMSKTVKKGIYTTSATQDYTVKIDVEGLQSGTTYYYQFTALNKTSLIGRTKTAPKGEVDNLNFGVVSCNNYPSGYFSAYRHVANIENLEAVLHLGDYIYEYGNGGYGGGLNRTLSPNHEIVTLNDYRMRYSLYRMDSDFIKAHQQHPFICIWDDHETANDSHKDGAQNHQNETEGNWETRKEVAKQAYFEWLPIRNNPTQTINRIFSYGDVMDLIMLDTRLEGRDEQVKSTKDPKLQNEERTMLGVQQRTWLFDALKSSKATWKIIGQQVIFSQFNTEFVNFLNRKKTGDSFLDIWNGYPAERLKVMQNIKENKVDNVVFLTGDFHSSFAFDVTTEPRNPSVYNPETGEGSIAVEFATPSITSGNFNEYLGEYRSRKVEECFNKPCGGFPFFYKKNPNPHIKYADIDRHGYVILNVSKAGVQADWYFMDDIKNPTSEQYYGASFFAKNGENRLQKTTDSIKVKLQNTTLNTTEVPVLPCLITGVFADSESVHVQCFIQKEEPVFLNLKNKNGKLIRPVLKRAYEKGIFTFSFFHTAYPKGQYTLEQTIHGKAISYPFEIK